MQKGKRVRARGQSTLEYILVVSAILAAIIAVVGVSVRPAVTNMLEDSQANIEAASDKVQTGLGL